MRQLPLDGVGLVIVDVVTLRHASLHRELLDLLRIADLGPAVPDLYAASYRTVPADPALLLEAWPERLAIGAALPQMPLWIGPDLCLPLDLECTYALACAARRIE